MSDKDDLIAELQIKITQQQALIDQYKAESLPNYKLASQALDKLKKIDFMGSGVIINIRSINGEILVNDVLLKDKISFIDNIKQDIEYSRKLIIELWG